jgi:NADPH:quinone reductase-like Zn-dependent oxidoreductase
MQAIQLETKGKRAIFVDNRPISTLPNNCLLVKTVAVGLNPHDLMDIYLP